MIKITSAKYADTIGSIDIFYVEDGEEKTYCAHPKDEAPLNVLLLGELEAQDIKVEPMKVLPPPTLENQALEYADSDMLRQKEFLRQLVTDQLAVLDSPRFRMQAELDPEFAVKRKQAMIDWFNVEKQAGYPWDIDFPEQWSERDV